MATCQAPKCSNELSGRQRRWCSDACKMRGTRAENGAFSGEMNRNNRNVTVQNAPKIDTQALAAQVAEIVVNTLREERDPLIGTTNRAADLLQEIRDLLKAQPRPAATPHNYPVQAQAAPLVLADDLGDTLDIRHAESDANPALNLITGILNLSGKHEEAARYRAELSKPKPSNGPKPLAGADVELAPPDVDDMEFEL